MNRRADVSTTESLPPSCSYMKPQHHPSFPTAASTERSLVTHTKPSARWPRQMYVIWTAVGGKVGPRLSLMFSCPNTFFIRWFNAPQHNATRINLVRACSLKVLFDLLKCIHSALWKTALMKLYTEPSQAELTPPIIHSFCWQQAGGIILERPRRTPCYESQDFWSQAIV